ncbi:MAG: hypothetical protein AAGD35_18480 [Actinomycetota bacterium]
MDTLLSVAGITLATCVLVTLIIFASWRFRPTAWAADIGLPRDTDPIGGAVVAIVVIVVMLGGAIAASVAAIDRFGLLGAAVAGWFVIAAFSLWDFLIIDWLVFIGLRPSWFALEGMDRAPQIYDWRHHAKESVPGLFLGLPIAAVSTAAAAFLT